MTQEEFYDKLDDKLERILALIIQNLPIPQSTERKEDLAEERYVVEKLELETRLARTQLERDKINLERSLYQNNQNK